MPESKTAVREYTGTVVEPDLHTFEDLNEHSIQIIVTVQISKQLSDGSERADTLRAGCELSRSIIEPDPSGLVLLLIAIGVEGVRSTIAI